MSTNKVVVFDVDETLGYFIELGIFWEALTLCIKEYTPNSILGQYEFSQILDLYPEFIRPNILSILNYLKHKKIKGECNAVMIYTNNQGPKEWVIHIKEYFENKLKYKLFDQIIAAFKVNGRQIEMCRTTHEKTFSDLNKCRKMPLYTQICFLDDLYHPKMVNDNIYYIKVKPYVHDISIETMLNRFISSSIGKTLIQNNYAKFIQDMNTHISKYAYVHTNKVMKEYEIDKIITKKTMVHLQLFFNKSRFHINHKNKNVYIGKSRKRSVSSIHHKRTMKMK
jgi:hypothetical protein